MKTYHYLSAFWLTRRSYIGKIMLVGFVGIHIPLIGAVIYFGTSDSNLFERTDILLTLLILTLLATGGTLWLLFNLVSPLKRAHKVLTHFHERGELLSLPHHYPDEVGQVMKAIRENLHHLGQTNNEKKEIISFLSHDLRTPVSQLVSLTELMQNESNPEQVKLYKSMIHQSARHLLQLQENLLYWVNYGYYNEHSEAIPVKNIPLEPLLQDIKNQLQGSLEMKSLRLEIIAGPPVHLLLNRELLKQCIMNLVTNAIKFSHPGQCIQLSWQQTDVDVQLFVKDEGIGLEAGMGDRIFERHSRFRRSGTQGEASHGFGLFFTRKILGRMGAVITASSEGTNKGSTFCIRFTADSIIVEPGSGSHP